MAAAANSVEEQPQTGEWRNDHCSSEKKIIVSELAKRSPSVRIEFHPSIKLQVHVNNLSGGGPGDRPEDMHKTGVMVFVSDRQVKLSFNGNQICQVAPKSCVFIWFDLETEFSQMTSVAKQWKMGPEGPRPYMGGLVTTRADGIEGPHGATYSWIMCDRQEFDRITSWT